MDKKRQIIERLLQTNATLPAEDYRFPPRIVVETTNVCNLACIMCPSCLQTRERGQMAMEVWKRIVDEVAEKSEDTSIWPALMGEGLTMGDQFIRMLEYACAKNITVIWNTNALLFNEKWIAEVSDLNLQEIIIGLDAATSEVYEKIRVHGDFHRVVKNVLALLAKRNNKTKITVQFIEQDLNQHQTEEFKRFWLAQGAIVKIRPRLGWGAGVAAPDLVLAQNERVGPCPWLIRGLAILWDGTIVQCDADWDRQYPVGNIADISIEKCWQGELAERRRRHRQGDFSFELCKNCNDWQAGLSKFYYPDNQKTAPII